MTPRERAAQRLLGLSAEAPPWRILGLPGVQASPAQIAAALGRRRRELHEQADSSDADRELAGALLTEAARVMAASHRWAHPAAIDQAWPILDAEIAAALRAAGRGQGARSELARRLSAIAAERRIPPSELLDRLRTMRVPAGPLPRVDARRRRAWRQGPLGQEVVGILDRLEIAERPDAGEPMARRVGSRSLAAAVSLLALGAIASWFLLGPSVKVKDPPDAAAATVPSDRGSAASDPATAAGPIAPEPASTSPDPPVPPSAAATAKLGWPAVALPAAATRAESDPWRSWFAEVESARSGAVRLPERLADLSERIRGARGEVAAEQLGAWREMHAIVGACWPLLSAAQRRAILSGVHACLAAVDSWRVAVELIEAIPPAPRGETPIDLWRMAWQAAALGDLAASGELAPHLREELSRAIATLGLPRRAGLVGRTPFEEMVARWLVAESRELSREPLGPGRSDRWWWWSAVAETLSPPLKESTELLAMRSLLEGASASESESSIATRLAVAAELLERIGPASAESPEAVRGELLGAIAGARVAAPVAAWLAAAIAALPGFEGWSDLPPLSRGAAFPERIAWAEIAGRRWPSRSASEGPKADGDLLSRWDRVRRELAASPLRSDAAALRVALQAGRLGEAAAWLGQDPRRAIERLEAIEKDLSVEPRDPPDPPIRAGRAIGLDGEWAEAMTAALGDAATRIELVRRLRSRGGDLGPRDAEAFVRAVVSDGPPVRTAAASLLLDRYSEGPEVLRRLLARLDGRPIDEALAAVLQRLAGGGLPALGDPSLLLEARRALLERLLRAESSEIRPLARLASRYAATVTGLAGAMMARGVDDADPEADPAGPMGRLAEALLAQVADPDEAGAIAERRELRLRLAEHPPQRLVAEQSATAEAIAAMLAAEGPAQGDAARAILASLSAQRRVSATSLEQAAHLALAIADLLRLRLHPSRPARAGVS